MKKLSIVIPTYNEENTIHKILKKINAKDGFQAIWCILKYGMLRVK